MDKKEFEQFMTKYFSLMKEYNFLDYLIVDMDTGKQYPNVCFGMDSEKFDNIFHIGFSRDEEDSEEEELCRKNNRIQEVIEEIAAFQRLHYHSNGYSNVKLYLSEQIHPFLRKISHLLEFNHEIE